MRRGVGKGVKREVKRREKKYERRGVMYGVDNRSERKLQKTGRSRCRCGVKRSVLW